ncbi:hypothetical protein N7474_005070 [Penicillium riverlandense]|uniref:uncharacterized protein n=1 Tax=Penicillium riverlandense TaxID=1903569 RepID=UPI002548B0BF|nr:uncharacterized protein N7474_005070 [Penicillium riverlandense]KAJ5819479.1 hypothetical protein N7474_005070 [Penicillium riverlandense]
MLPAVIGCMSIRVYATNSSVLQSIINPWVQGGQQIIRSIIQLVRELQKDQVDLHIGWIGSEQDTSGISMAKAAAQYATRKSSPPNPPTGRLNEQAHNQQFWQDPFGKHTKAIDSALPGKHTRDMYDQLHREQASTLAQLRTGHARLNRYLRRIGQTLDDTCDCQEGPETVNHFLFDCKLWESHRGEMRATMGNRYRDTSFALGGRSRSQGPTAQDLDPSKNWTPNMEVVKSVIQFAMATNRLNRET